MAAFKCFPIVSQVINFTGNFTVAAQWMRLVYNFTKELLNLTKTPGVSNFHHNFECKFFHHFWNLSIYWKGYVKRTNFTFTNFLSLLRGVFRTQSNIHDGALGLKICNFNKKRLQHRCFPVNILKFLRTAFFMEHLWCLLLKAVSCMTFNQVQTQN